VRVRRLRDLGLVILLLAGAAACTPAETAPPEAGVDVAVRAYSPPAGVPGFCALLADSAYLTELPEAVGTLTVEPGDVEAKLLLTAAITELDGVLADVRERPGFLALERSVDELLTTLRDARDERLTETARTAIVSGLDDIGHQVQPICGFPT
jgi:hypothetical protein